MFGYPRRSATKVRNGQVQRKNRSARTPHYLTEEMPSLVIDRRKPGRGFKHVVRKDDVRRFIQILPEWDELRMGLDAIVLDGGEFGCQGWHRPGVVAICAWDRDIEWDDCLPDFYEGHAEVFEKLDIPVEFNGLLVKVKFTEPSARAFLLIHVLVHELGHHHDRMTTRSRRRACRGEAFAESYARRHEDQIIKRYRRISSM